MQLMTWLTTATAGKVILTMLVSMLPVVELRGGIPFGVGGLGLSYSVAFWAAVAGNIIPIPFIVIYIRRVFQWLRVHLPPFGGLVDRLEKKAHLKGRKVSRYRGLGLYILVAIPLPGTGAWTGAMVAACLDIRLKKAFPAIALGVVTAGLIMIGLTAAGVNLFA